MRNTILAILIICSAFAKAQDCKYDINKVDDFTGEKVLFTKPVRIGTLNGGSYLRFYLSSVDDYYAIGIRNTAVDGCASSDSYLSVKLENGEVYKLPNVSDIDCSEKPIFSFSITDVIEELKASPIDKIRLSTSRGYYDSYKIKDPNYFIDGLDCITQ